MSTLLGPWSHLLFKFLFKKMTNRNTNMKLRDYYFQMAVRAKTGSGAFNKFIEFSHCWTRTRWRVPLAHRVHTLEVPMVLIWGENDQLVGMQYARLLHSTRAHAGTPLMIVTNGSHNPSHSGRANAFVDAVQRGLEEMATQQAPDYPETSLLSMGDCGHDTWWCSCVEHTLQARPSPRVTAERMQALEDHVSKRLPTDSPRPHVVLVE
mmetsp:Transcript_66462/g.156890  ORF Transcript_66462/g.156890 Transcript_66462/m.156890 type:complete len:208 (+) Transcript_66462:47-670(+)